jgi:hypothetical protein
MTADELVGMDAGQSSTASDTNVGASAPIDQTRSGAFSTR